MRRSIVVVLLSLVALAAATTAATAAPGDVARYILPPGNFGGLPTNENSTRPAAALRRAHAVARTTSPGRDINRLFLPENFKPIGRTRDEQTGRAGLRLIYD